MVLTIKLNSPIKTVKNWIEKNKFIKFLLEYKTKSMLTFGNDSKWTKERFKECDLSSLKQFFPSRYEEFKKGSN